MSAVIAVTNMLAPANLLELVVNSVKNFMGFPPLGITLVATLGIGIAQTVDTGGHQQGGAGILAAILRSSAQCLCVVLAVVGLGAKFGYADCASFTLCILCRICRE